jgi:hypothetical protein
MMPWRHDGHRHPISVGSRVRRHRKGHVRALALHTITAMPIPPAEFKGARQFQTPLSRTYERTQSGGLGADIATYPSLISVTRTACTASDQYSHT